MQRAREEADLARQRFMQTHPEHRMVADVLEAEWNAKLRALDEAQQELERRRAEIEPTLWRRVDVPLTSTLLALHDIIQVTVGWTDSHLFEFVVGDCLYSELVPDDELVGRKIYDAAGIRLRTLIGRGVERLLYVYDFGDNWRHDVFIEDVRDGEADVDYPAFVAGERRCPPEDVGGVPGFMRFLEAALNPFHDEHEEVLTWYGKPFDRDDIDEHYVRMALTTIANRRRGALMRHRAAE